MTRRGWDARTRLNTSFRPVLFLQFFAESAIPFAAEHFAILARKGAFATLLTKSQAFPRQQVDTSPEEQNSTQKDGCNKNRKQHGNHVYEPCSYIVC